MDRVDFRSDTVTWPTPRMREAMAKASLGDDVYGEDPTVNALERQAASLIGTESALLVSSGTMGNLVAALAWGSRGDEVIVGQDSHCYRAEAGGISALGGMLPRVLPTDSDGRMTISDIESAVRPDDPHYGRTRLIMLENSYAARAGNAIPVSYFEQVAALAGDYDLSVHLDGARLFNAATALGVPASEISSHVDSVSFCLSKGLCAPVGSILCGSEAFIRKARRARKIVGGGMRQAGVIAAAGIIALEEMIDRLLQDHQCARRLADGLRAIPGIDVMDVSRPTNMVFFSLEADLNLTADEVAQRMVDIAGIYIDQRGDKSFRIVTHYWVGEREVSLFLDTLEIILGGDRN